MFINKKQGYFLPILLRRFLIRERKEKREKCFGRGVRETERKKKEEKKKKRFKAVDKNRIKRKHLFIENLFPWEQRLFVG